MIIKSFNLFENFTDEDFLSIKDDIKYITDLLPHVELINVIPVTGYNNSRGIIILMNFKKWIDIDDISDEIINLIMLLKREKLQLNYIDCKIRDIRYGVKTIRTWDWGRQRGERLYKNVAEFKNNALSDVETNGITLKFI
jgi:hypothetical protein